MHVQDVHLMDAACDGCMHVQDVHACDLKCGHMNAYEYIYMNKK
jgi:hypothetical protein